jgi:hypothetical protein
MSVTTNGKSVLENLYGPEILTRAFCFECNARIEGNLMLVNPKTGKAFCSTDCKEKHESYWSVVPLERFKEVEDAYWRRVLFEYEGIKGRVMAFELTGKPGLERTLRVRLEVSGPA